MKAVWKDYLLVRSMDVHSAVWKARCLAVEKVCVAADSWDCCWAAPMVVHGDKTPDDHWAGKSGDRSAPPKGSCVVDATAAQMDAVLADDWAVCWAYWLVELSDIRLAAGRDLNSVVTTVLYWAARRELCSVDSLVC